MASEARSSTLAHSDEGLESVSQFVARNGPDVLHWASNIGAVAEDERNHNNVSSVAVAEKSLLLAQTAAQVAWGLRNHLDAYDDQNTDFERIQLDLLRAFYAVLEAMPLETHSGTEIHGITSELPTEMDNPVDIGGPYIPDSHLDVSPGQILAPSQPAVLGDIGKSEAHSHHVCETCAGFSANAIYDTLTECLAEPLLEPLVARVTDRLLAELPEHLVGPLGGKLIPALGNRIQEAVHSWRPDLAVSGSGVTKASSGPLDPVMTAPSGFKMRTTRSLDGTHYLRSSEERKRRRTGPA
ncbi:hypothetical protein LXA43DRAFT_1090920 [Ganoderma leucocontextum]|nr:hypothetical protein LXA43DRAFT_1090920 [Ganoderma leucocontextum]